LAINSFFHSVVIYIVKPRYDKLMN